MNRCIVVMENPVVTFPQTIPFSSRNVITSKLLAKNLSSSFKITRFCSTPGAYFCRTSTKIEFFSRDYNLREAFSLSDLFMSISSFRSFLFAPHGGKATFNGLDVEQKDQKLCLNY